VFKISVLKWTHCSILFVVCRSWWQWHWYFRYDSDSSRILFD